VTRKRHLRPEEEALWQEVARRTVPISPRRQAMPLAAKAAPQEDSAPPRPVEPFHIGQKARSGPRDYGVLPGVLSGSAEKIAAAPVAMDRKAFERLKRGKLVPEARIDLHGMTLDQARAALAEFILRTQGQGKRLVLVVTGKGKDRDDGGPIPVRRGVLRHNVPLWLRMAPLAPLVLHVAEAHHRHGGGGACYVYLRRRR
jgi:DNA-nicking Smr family endonuclease